MRYYEPVFRPPSEANSLILQVTVGCSHNSCVFCAMYRNKSYFVRPLKEILGEIAESAELMPGITRVFLGDGDALSAPTDYLIDVLSALNSHFTSLRRISLYATPMNLLQKTPDELESLREAGIRLFYLGVESGSDKVLHRMAKGATARETIAGVLKGRNAGIKASLMVLLGLGGVEGSRDHALETASVLNAMQPEFASALTWFPVEQAPLFKLMKREKFHLPDDMGILAELELMIENLKLKDTVFKANHASNPLPIGGRLSRDSAKLLDLIRAARNGRLPLRPAYLRGT